jgi:elongation factor P
MAMLDYSEVKEHKIVLHDGEPWEVLSSHVFRMQMRKPVNQTKLKNLISGRVVEITFHQNDKVAEADIDTREVKYLYTNRGESWFCDPENPKDRFTLNDEQMGNALKYIKPNDVLTAKVFDEKIFGLKVPAKVELKVKDAPPAVKGDTSGRANKIVTLETGATVGVPLFIGEGDIIRINTETGEYAERVEKA